VAILGASSDAPVALWDCFVYNARTNMKECDMPKYSADGALITYNPLDLKLISKGVVLQPLSTEAEKIEKLREETKEKYSGILGKKYAIIFYEITEKELVVTEFFRAVLIDPEFYIHNLYFKHGIMAAAVDEFTLNENWKSKAERETDEGLFAGW